MSNRTTINVDKETHSEAGDVKDEYDETWPEVLAFYAEYRPQVDSLGEDTNAEPMQVVPVEEVVGRDVPTESVRSGPVELEATEYRKIADEVAGRLR